MPIFATRLYPSHPADLPEALRTSAASLHRVGGESYQQTPKGAQRQAKGIVSCFEPLIAERDEVTVRPQREKAAMGDEQVSELTRCIRWCKQMCWCRCRARPPPSHSHQPSPCLHHLLKAALALSQQIFTAHISNIKLIQLN